MLEPQPALVQTLQQSKKPSKTSGLAFKPPKPSPTIRNFIRLIQPFIFDHFLGRFRVEIDEESLERLRRIKNERTLILPNHPAQWDPWAILELSRRMGEHFYYVVAREVFDWHHGIQGWLLQRMGCYSVVRGASDKDSFKTTKDTLQHNRGRLVIFVEGEISNQNDSLLPLEPGVIQLAFLSLQDIYKQNNRDLDSLPSLYVCPTAIKYIYEPKGLTETIEKALANLEKATGIPLPATSHYERVRAIGRKVLDETSSQFGYPLSFDDSIDDQIRGLENFMLTKLEQVVNLLFETHLSYLERVRRIRNMVDKLLKDVPEDLTPYQARLFDHQKAVLKNFYWDLDRIVNFIAIYDGYMHPDMTAERYVEVIRRLEKEVYGWYHLRHPRTVYMKVLEPIDLKSYFPQFLQDKKKTTEAILGQVESALYQAIIALPPQARHEEAKKVAN